MAADTCKGIMNTTLFAGTVIKGFGTRLAGSRAVKIQNFAQSAGNFSAFAEGSSETTRVDPSFNFSAHLGELIDRDGHFSVRARGKLAFQLRFALQDPVLIELQTRFSAKVKLSDGIAVWRTTDRDTIAAIITAVNGQLRLNRRFRQLAAVCAELQIAPRRPAG